MAELQPQPVNILRGHKAQIHAASFIRNNERLVTGDAEGFVVVWDLTIMRARAVWRAHENAILGIRGWGLDKLITHGRDHKLIVWKLGVGDEDALSSSPPLEHVATPRPQPWILHLLEVNTMNFCSFALCARNADSPSLNTAQEVLIAVPNTLASESIDIYGLPNQSRLHTIHPGQKNGMAMSLSLFHKANRLAVVAAFENGFASVHVLNESTSQWITTYRSQIHTQPVLSLDVHPNLEYFLTSAADAIIAKHPVPLEPQVLATMKKPTPSTSQRPSAASQSGLSAAFASMSNDSSAGFETKSQQPWTDPIKLVNTKHSGQQGLSIRSDGRIFATAGWDTNIRVYSTKTLKEMAVLQWHKVGVYAVALAKLQPNTIAEDNTVDGADAENDTCLTTHQATMTVKERRVDKARATHWIAAGAKDGKVTLWDIY